MGSCCAVGHHGKLCSGVVMGKCCAVGSSWEIVGQQGLSGKLLFSGLQQCNQGNCCSAVLSLKLLFSGVVSKIVVLWGRQVNCYSGGGLQ